MTASDHSLIVITPVYEDCEASGRLFKELAALFGRDLHVVAVDDGSVRRPLDLGAFRAAGLSGTILKLRRNVGHQRAIAVGLGYVAGWMQPHQRVVVMDCDGEDRPDTIAALLERLRSDEVDIVVAQRKRRVETLRFKLFYAVYQSFFRVLTGRSINFGNFMALKPAAVKRLVAMQELSIHIAGTVLASKLRVASCPIDRGSRYAGQSQMNFIGLTLHGFKGLMVFAEDVLVRVGIVCATIGTLSVLGAISAVTLKLLGHSTPGWSSVVLGIMVLTFLQTGALALMTLMLTGVMRGGTVTTGIAYRDFIEQVLETGKG